MRACCQLAGFRVAKPDCFQRAYNSALTNDQLAKQHGAHYDAAAAAGCVAAQARATDECPSFKYVLLQPSRCVNVYGPGDLPTGATCDAPGECGAGDVCLDFGGISSACEPLVVVGKGQPCGGSRTRAVECQTGLVCQTNAVCEPLTPLGAPCPYGNHGDLCVPGATCDWSGSKTCVPAVPVGSPCSEQDQCEGYACYGGRCRLNPDFVPSALCEM